MIIRLTVILFIMLILSGSSVRAADTLLSLEGLRNPFRSTMPPEKPKVVTAPKVKKVMPPIEKKVIKPVEKPVPALKLMGMVWGEAQPQAIINSKIVSIGSVVEGAKVVGITKEGVSLVFDNKKISLKVGK